MIQLTTTETTYSTTEFQLLTSTDGPLNTSDKTMCLTQLQLDLLEEALIRVSTTEIAAENFEFLWDLLKKLNPGEEQPMEKIIKRGLHESKTDRFDYFNNGFKNSFLKLLKFVNQSSNKSWKLAGYQTLFNEIAFNTTKNHELSLFLNLQHYVSQDESINSDADVQTLLSNVESVINNLIQNAKNLDLSYYDSQCDCRPVIHSEYLIKRICSEYPSKIEILWNALSKKYSVELLLQFITELETNNRMNYTLLVISEIKREMYSLTSSAYHGIKCYHPRYQLYEKLRTLPKNGILRNLLSQNEFYIKNAYDQQYLHMTEKSSDYYSRPTSTRIFTSSDRNFIWTVNHPERKQTEIYDKHHQKIGTKKCDIHEEWYVTGTESTYSAAMWILEIVGNDRVRVKNVVSEEYLRVGNRNRVASSDLNGNELSKFEWILESDQDEDYFDKDYECTNTSDEPENTFSGSSFSYLQVINATMA